MKMMVDTIHGKDDHQYDDAVFANAKHATQESVRPTQMDCSQETSQQSGTKGEGDTDSQEEQYIRDDVTYFFGPCELGQEPSGERGCEHPRTKYSEDHYQNGNDLGD